MNKTIFYSWQADLPAKTNRTFIESCIERAIKQIKQKSLHLEVAIDRDVSNVPGTPDISHSIFNKIVDSNVFIADISFIDDGKGKKRMPNPNVLIELGYAARALGWENIICVFNADYGKVEDLPFDLRHRHPLIYSIANTANKTDERAELSNRLQKAIEPILKKQSSKDKIIENLKIQLDKMLLSVCGDIRKILYGYSRDFVFSDIFKMLDLQDQEISKLLTEREFLGFQIAKEWSHYKEHIDNLIQNPIFSKYIEEEKLAPIIDLSNILQVVESNFKHRRMFEEIPGKVAERIDILPAHHTYPSNPEDSYIVLSKKSKEATAGMVVDSGIILKYNVARTKKYYKISDDELSILVNILTELLRTLDQVVNAWGNSIMIDPATYNPY